MGRDQRVRDNHALLAAQAEALEHGLGLIVVFNLLTKSGYRKREHYEFMVSGLKEVEKDLAANNIAFMVTIGPASKNLIRLTQEMHPRSLYFDFSPLRGPRATQKLVAKSVSCRIAVVDTHNIVPAWVTSDKEEFAAHTIRRKLHRLIAEWAVEPGAVQNHPYTFDKKISGATWNDVESVVKTIPASGIRHGFKPGEAAAEIAMQQFIESRLSGYADGRNDANTDGQSNLSPYLHYGQVSSLRVLLSLMDSTTHLPQLFNSLKMPGYVGEPTAANAVDSFVEELIVRKELSDNFCFYNSAYDSLDGARDWAKKTLADHANDSREFTYTKQQFEAAQTHDELWNAAQLQLTKSGKIHGYMRMYWAKKILEWTDSPERAIQIAIELNDTYHLDGGDPNGYVGILWSMAGIHDRPWFNRSVYGSVRYMAESGAKKKFDTKRYIERWV